MSVCSYCGHEVTHTSSFSDQIGIALDHLSPTRTSTITSVTPSAADRTVFHALIYLGRSRDPNDQLAFHLLHQLFVILTRHDPESDVPGVNEMWDIAGRKALESNKVM
jgi:hypothetical protein